MPQTRTARKASPAAFEPAVVLQPAPVAECNHIECLVCPTVENRNRLTRNWIHVLVTLEGPGGTSESVPEGVVCSLRCLRLWQRSVEAQLPAVKPTRGRPRKVAAPQ